MQMICEAYHLMTDLLGMTAKEVGDTFSIWNEGELDSFLMEISADALQQKDPRTGGYLVDYVLDAAGQKGTGKWTSVNALDMGTPAPTVAEAVFARCMSAIKEERGYASKSLTGPDEQVDLQSLDRSNFLEAIRGALYCSKICSYAQGFQLMQAAAKEYDWSLNFGEIAQIWRGGCIIRAAFLQKITEAYQKNSSLANLLLDDYFNDCIKRDQSHWRKVIATGALRGVPTPTFSSALAYYDSYRSTRLPQNLLQAQRDYFGAHTYERTDEPRGNFFHMDWLHPERPETQG
jgi:6-phosphogluconate dehydrogenase